MHHNLHIPFGWDSLAMCVGYKWHLFSHDRTAFTIVRVVHLAKINQQTSAYSFLLRRLHYLQWPPQRSLSLSRKRMLSYEGFVASLKTRCVSLTTWHWIICWKFRDGNFAKLATDVLRLQHKKPLMGECNFWHFCLLRLLCISPSHGCARVVYEVNLTSDGARKHSVVMNVSWLPLLRSCELDEWRHDQLQAMKLGGNANARSFFKRHGLTDTEMRVRDADSLVELINNTISTVF